MKSTSEFNNFFEITNDQDKIIKLYHLEFKKIDYSDWNVNYLKSKQDFDDLIISKINNQKLNLEIFDLKKLLGFMEVLSHLDRAPNMLIKHLESNPKDLTLLNEKLYNFYLSKEDDSKFYGNLIGLLKIRQVGFAMATLFSCYFNNKKFPFYSDQQWSIVRDIFKIPNWDKNFVLKEQLDFYDNLHLKERKFVYKIYILIKLRNYINRFSSEAFDFFDLNLFLWHIYKNKPSEQIHGEILKQWKIVLENYANLDLNDRYHFNIEKDKERMNKIKDKVKNFIQNHEADEKMFIDFWNELYSAMMGGSAKNVIKKNRTEDGLFAIEKVKNTLDEMLESKNYSLKWEDEEHINGTQKTLWELYGVLHNDIPILNNCSRTALNYLLGKNIKRNYYKIREALEKFKDIYLKEIGHVTGSPETPVDIKTSIYVEIDKLFNIVDKIKDWDDIEKVNNKDVKKLYELVLELKNLDVKRGVKYWIFQSNPKFYNLERAVKEIDEDLFRVTRYKKQIEEGDKVLFWVSGENAGLVGYGDILSNPNFFSNLEEFQDSEKFIMDENFRIEGEAKDILKVKVSYNPLKRISKEEVLSIIENKQIDPLNISLFRSSQGTNFPINKVIWDLLVNNITATGISEWVCPLKSCNHKTISIDRNNGVIKTNSWEDIIIHFLQHLNKSRIYFGPSNIEEFLKRDIQNILSEADRQIYEYDDHGNEEYWRNRIRTALGPLKNQKGYIFTDKSSDDPSFRSHFQTRRRTNKFFKDFKNYDDWPKEFEKYPKRKKLDTSLLDPNEIEKVHNLLLYSKQIILYGPPGTGKTYFAQVLTQKITENKYEIVQFHPSYSYEDFVEWIEAIPSEDGKSVIFQPKPKIFRNLCEIALDNQDDNVVLIIDEINRGDLGRIFGELILGLEPSNRNLGIKTPLSYSLGDLKIPENIYIIATMNSVDRSIAIVDYALRRRFLFYLMMPSSNILEKWVNNPDFKISEILKKRILSLFTNLNKKIKEERKLGKHYQIGHTYFFVKSEEELRIRWDYMIKPLLEEYLNFNEENLSDYDYDGLIRET